MKKSSLIKGNLASALEAARNVNELQQTKLSNGHTPNFCYFDNVDENWYELVESDSTNKSSRSARLELV